MESFTSVLYGALRHEESMSTGSMIWPAMCR